MPKYRYCFLDADGGVRGGLDVECADDDQAVAGAAELEHVHGMKVWQGERLVAVVPGFNHLA
jgi:hypothetical protein